MAKQQYMIERGYKMQKDMYNKVRKVLKRFVDSDMMAGGISRLLNDVLDMRVELDDKGKEISEDMNKYIREKQVWKMAFKYDKTTCTADSCLLLRKWISRNGFSVKATSMEQFNPANMSNITTDDMPEGDGSSMADEDDEFGGIEAYFEE